MVTDHRAEHPRDVPGCWKCRMGVGRRSTVAGTYRTRQGTDPTRIVPIIADDGPRRGHQVGAYTQHWDGRQDATIRPPTIAVRSSVDTTGEST